MALKIVTGGTTGQANGTLVSSGNKIVFTALDAVVDCHIRADDDTYSADTTFSMPSDGQVQVSFDGGSTWKAFANNPASYGVDIGDLNVAIKLRQHANAAASTGTFQTDATTPGSTALADVTGFTVTPGSSQNVLAWSAVTNRTSYRVDRATNSGFTTGVALDISPGLTATTVTDTGLTNGTTYYYRIKAVGTVRYKDSANYATGNGAPVSGTTVSFYPSMDGQARAYSAGSSTFATIRAAAGTDAYPAGAELFAGYCLPTPGSAGTTMTDRMIGRSHIHFDTSSLPDGATIVSARLRLYGHTTYTKSTMNSASSAVLVGSNWTAGAAVTVNAFPTLGSPDCYPLSNFGSTEFSSRKTYAAWTDGAYNDFTLNSSGLAAINTTGTTRFGLLQAADFDNSEPTGGGNVLGFYFYPSEASGTSTDPILEVTYT